MRLNRYDLRKIALSAFSLAALVFTVSFGGPASASPLGVKSSTLQAAVAFGASEGVVIKVGHRHKRWRRGRGGFHIYVGDPFFPYYGYGYYPRSSYRYCRKWRRECAYRYGWGSYRWSRCVRRRGCR